MDGYITVYMDEIEIQKYIAGEKAIGYKRTAGQRYAVSLPIKTISTVDKETGTNIVFRQ